MTTVTAARNTKPDIKKNRRAEAEALLTRLLDAGAIPVIDAGRLRIEAPAGTLGRELRDALNRCRPELRWLVMSRWRSHEQCAARIPCRRMTVCAEPRDGRPCRTPATCVDCGGPLPPGNRYRCPTCVEGR